MAWVLTGPVLLSFVVALRWRLPHTLMVFLPLAVLANPYVAAMVLLLLLFVRFFPGREPFLTHRAVFPVLLSVVWVAYAVMITPLGGSLVRWVAEMTQLVLGLLLFLAVATSVVFRLDWTTLAKGLVATAVVLSAIAVLRGLTGFAFNESGPLGPNPDNYSANMIIFGLVCVASGAGIKGSGQRTWSLSQVLLTVVCLLGVYFNESRASLLAAIVVLVVTFTLYRAKSPKVTLVRFFFAGVIAVAGVGLVLVYLPSATLSQMILSTTDFSGANFSNAERLALLINSVQLFFSNPAGHGIGSSSDLFANSFLTQGSYPHPHNTLATFAVELGVVGIAIYVALVAFLLYIAFRGLHELRADPVRGRFAVSMAAAFGLITLYDSIFFNGLMAIFAFAVLGLMLPSIQPLATRRQLPRPEPHAPAGPAT